MIEYYDLVLGLIPLVLVSVAGGLTGAGIGHFTAMALASLVAIGLIAHGLFVRTPIQTESEQAMRGVAD
ncbi:conserved hypothetical protein [Halorhabdus utahensis DSM 12940]|uniref:Uncharacterized protein n=1 Tax=Halorhabdus utahensis (strain DSM 12940 / JCM 11049 / AX-2) TaxID=519442 RepID=C7NMX4_HALUD|nr:hypothetical protein [Halorhabdus utahensis]ACV12672.1 conserved hypothetical protein [Halorhabdus utahensis DSM 12940]